MCRLLIRQRSRASILRKSHVAKTTMLPEAYWISSLLPRMPRTMRLPMLHMSLLAARPDVMDKMCDEFESLLVKGAKGARSKIRDAGALLYTCNKVTNQLMHCKPPVPMIAHLSKKPSYLGGHYIGKGAILVPSFCSVPHGLVVKV